MGYDIERLNAGDPAYAPGISRSKGIAYWRAPRGDVADGYAYTREKLTGSEAEQAARCRQLAREIVRWREEASAPKIEPFTWGHLIQRYTTDPESPFTDVKPNTRDGYWFWLKKWQLAIGETDFSGTCQADVIRWRRAMETNGRSDAYVKRLFVGLRILASYAVALRWADASEVRSMLSTVRMKSPKARKEAPTREQIMAVIDAARNEGAHAFALGILFQFSFALRAVDVRGQWIDGNGAISRGGKHWVDGLVWGRHIDLHATRLVKETSKTDAGLDLDITAVPLLRERLLAIPIENRSGPVILSERSGLPYTTGGWSQAWARHRKAAGIPEGIWMMDTRAGALSEADRMGAAERDVQHAATHKSPQMTARYTRNQIAAQNRVAAARFGSVPN